MFYTRGSSGLRDRTRISCVSCIGRQVLYHLESPHRKNVECETPFPEELNQPAALQPRPRPPPGPASHLNHPVSRTGCGEQPAQLCTALRGQILTPGQEQISSHTWMPTGDQEKTLSGRQASLSLRGVCVQEG